MVQGLSYLQIECTQTSLYPAPRSRINVILFGSFSCNLFPRDGICLGANARATLEFISTELADCNLYFDAARSGVCYSRDLISLALKRRARYAKNNYYCRTSRFTTKKLPNSQPPAISRFNRCKLARPEISWRRRFASVPSILKDYIESLLW